MPDRGLNDHPYQMNTQFLHGGEAQVLTSLDNNQVVMTSLVASQLSDGLGRRNALRLNCLVTGRPRPLMVSCETERSLRSKELSDDSTPPKGTAGAWSLGGDALVDTQSEVLPWK